MPTLLSGTGETSIQNVDNNVRDMDTPVYELEPSATPLTVLLNAMGAKAARQPKVEWLSLRLRPLAKRFALQTPLYA